MDSEHSCDSLPFHDDGTVDQKILQAAQGALRPCVPMGEDGEKVREDARLAAKETSRDAGARPRENAMTLAIPGTEVTACVRIVGRPDSACP